MIRLKVLFMALLLSLGLPAMAQQVCGVSDSVARVRANEYYYLQARSLMEQDSIDCCFEILEHCHALDTSSLTVMYDLSSFYAFWGKDSLAHDMLNRVVKADPSNIYYNKALINYYLKSGNIDAAIGVNERLLESVHSRSDIYMSLFSLYSDAGYHEKAIGVLEKIERLEGTSEEIIINKVRLYIALGESAKALDVISSMINDSPDDLRYLALLGNTYQLLGEREKALEVYKDILAVKPDDVYALVSLAELHTEDENDSIYCSYVDRLLKCEDFDTQARIELLVQRVEYLHANDSIHAMNLMKEMYALPFDELEIADVYSQYLIHVNAPSDTIVPVLEKILYLEPDNLPTILRLLDYAVKSDDLEAVYKYADNASMYCPDRLEICFYKGLSLSMLERHSESVEAFRKGLEKRASDSEPAMVSTIFGFMGDTYHEMGMINECMQAYDSALVYNGENLGVLNNYAYFLALDNKNLDRALEMSHKTITLEPENTTYIDTYAWVLFKLGRYEEAKAYAEKCISIGEETSPDVFHHIGDIYARCGDMEQAVNYWIKAKDAGDDSAILAKKIKKRKYYKDAKLK